MLIHYYYGDRFNALFTTIGSAIRAKGHDFNVEIVVVDPSKIIGIDSILKFHNIKILTKQNELFEQLDQWLNQDTTDKKCLYVIINFDIIYNSLTEELQEELLAKLSFLKHKAELMLTGEKEITELLKISDYVSLFQNSKDDYCMA